MSIPAYDELFLPVLELLGNEETISSADIVDALAA